MRGEKREDAMSKMNQLAQQQSERDKELPAEVENEFANFEQAAAFGLRANLLGVLLKYKKGKWRYGQDDIELPIGTELIALMSEARHGYVHWHKGKPDNYALIRIADGGSRPARDSLGDLDESRWPVGLSGTREDPWAETVLLPFMSLDGEQVFTWTSKWAGGKTAFYTLCKRYAWIGRKYPRQFPVVAVGTETAESKTYGEYDRPTLEIVRWTDRPVLQLAEIEQRKPDAEPSAEPSLRSDLNDEIPF
jgi:hypothetical protein